jgi:hypothetical protein
LLAAYSPEKGIGNDLKTWLNDPELLSVMPFVTCRPPLRAQEPAPRSAPDGIDTEAQAYDLRSSTGGIV